MGVYKRKLAKGIRWYFSGQFQGQKYFSKAMFLTRAECLVAEREKLAELEGNLEKPQNEMLLVEVMNTRLDEIKENLSKHYYTRIIHKIESDIFIKNINNCISIDKCVISYCITIPYKNVLCENSFQFL